MIENVNADRRRDLRRLQKKQRAFYESALKGEWEWTAAREVYRAFAKRFFERYPDGIERYLSGIDAERDMTHRREYVATVMRTRVKLPPEIDDRPIYDEQSGRTVFEREYLNPMVGVLPLAHMIRNVPS